MVLRTKTTFCNSAVVSLNKSHRTVRRDVNIYGKKRSGKTSSVLTFFFFFSAKQHLILTSLVWQSTRREISPRAEGGWLRQKTVWNLRGVWWKSGSVSQRRHVPVPPGWWQMPTPPTQEPQVLLGSPLGWLSLVSRESKAQFTLLGPI